MSIGIIITNSPNNLKHYLILSVMTNNNISLINGDIETKRAEIKQYFNETYSLYESIFELLATDEVFYEQPNSLRQPLIFYFGHTATFFINKLIAANIISDRVNSELESIFAIGVDEMSWDDLNDKHYNFPTVDKTRAYRNEVRGAINDLIDALPLSMPIGWESPFWIIMMGIEHERIHIETTSVLIRELDIEFVRPNSSWRANIQSSWSPINELLPVNGMDIEIGKRMNSDYYGWDNEYGTHKATVADFRASKYLVSNGEFLEFMRDGGYKSDTYWETEGNDWREYAKVRHPHFWIDDFGVYKLRTLCEIVDLPLNHPVEVNYHEAKAFCNWLSAKLNKSIRLPSEDEWYALALHCELDDKMDANIGLIHTSTTAIDSFAHGDFFDIRGNVWQWSETPIYPFDGFKVHPAYDDFTVPTYDGRHNLIKGGSWISTGNEALLTARYAFRKHFYQHAGFRYVQSDTVVDSENIYETDTLVSQYAQFGWGEEFLGVANYPKECAKICIESMDSNKRRKALDVGCAIGRSSFELARGFDEVIGIDFSARFVSQATKLKESGEISYRATIEGDLTSTHSVMLEQYDLVNEAKKVSFWQGDACNLKSHLCEFDLIFAGNLIDRLYNPKSFLTDMAWRLNSGGLLVIASPYTWLEEFTPKEAWIGGYEHEGKEISTIEGLKYILKDEFELVKTRDVPFVIRETARKYQHSVAQLSVWKKL
jgi:5-histidylcysteine sulfoxide synthase/putative 4-mercaptohistidine N1-methyltranferase